MYFPKALRRLILPIFTVWDIAVLAQSERRIVPSLIYQQSGDQIKYPEKSKPKPTGCTRVGYVHSSRARATIIPSLKQDRDKNVPVKSY